MDKVTLARLQEKEDLGEKADQAMTAIDLDTSAIPGADTSELKDILLRALQRQRKFVRVFKYLITKE